MEWERCLANALAAARADDGDSKVGLRRLCEERPWGADRDLVRHTDEHHLCARLARCVRCVRACA